MAEAGGAGAIGEPKALAGHFVFYSSPELAIVCLAPREARRASLEDAAELTGVHPQMLLYYCRLGLLGSDRTASGLAPTFDDEALGEVRRIEHYRKTLGVQRQALTLVCALWREGRRLDIELKFLDPDSRPGSWE